MAWGNAVLSRTQYDVESCLTGRGCQANVPTCANSRTQHLALYRRIQRPSGHGQQGMNHGFENIVGGSGALRGVLDLVRIVAPTDSTALIEGEPELERNLSRAPFTGTARAETAPL
jgi:hypothetical protein